MGGEARPSARNRSGKSVSEKCAKERDMALSRSGGASVSMTVVFSSLWNSLEAEVDGEVITGCALAKRVQW